MNRRDRILAILSRELKPSYIELRDDSHKHAGHSGAAAGGETHYELIIEVETFAHMTKVQRHQAIYALLADEFKTGLHALSIQAFAPGER